MASSPLKVTFGLMELYYGKFIAMDYNLIMGKNNLAPQPSEGSEGNSSSSFLCLDAP